jgi:hypothetical protein
MTRYAKKKDKKKKENHYKINKLFKEAKKYRGSLYYEERETEYEVNKYSEKYRVTSHASIRFLERVIKQEVAPEGADMKKAAEMIRDNLEFDISSAIGGYYPFLDDFVAVIRDGLVVTILEKSFVNERVKTLSEFLPKKDKKLKEIR